jgi:hypothetical protein
MSEQASNTYTVEDWLFGCVNFDVPASAVTAILADRGVSPGTSFEAFSAAGTTLPDKRLLKADLLKWIVLGIGKRNSVSDSDNGWSHSEGGYTLSKDDKKLLMDEANAIYDELEPDSTFGKKRTRLHSLGIMPAQRDTDGTPLPRNPAW